MSSGLNRVELIGRLGADPEARTTGGGTPVSNLRLATSESWKDKSTGEKQERTEWHRVVLYGRIAEVANQYLRKGAQVFLAGSLHTRKWQDKEGIERYTTEIVARDLVMLGSRGGSASPPEPQNLGRARPVTESDVAQQSDFDDDIPFAWAALIPFAGVLLHAVLFARAIIV